MNTFLALLRKDLKGYFDQPTGYVLLVIFVGVTSWLFFRTALAAGSQDASLRALFDALPFILAIFIPAATMRLFAEELRDGTLELLLTQPLRSWTVLGSKFASGLTFVTTGIILTIGIPLLLETSGNMDTGAIAAQYIGSIFFAGSLVAIGMFGSSLTRNQIVAFILALFINIVLIVIGLSFVTLTVPSSVAVLMQDLSPLTHFGNMAKGVIALRDVIYFIALIALFLSGTYLSLRSRTLSHSTQLYKNLRLGVAGLVIASILAGWFGNSIAGRWDMTEDRVYTLSPATEDLVTSLDDLLTINLYVSSDPPVQIAGSTREIQGFLEGLDAKSDMVRVVTHTADKDDISAEAAMLAGIPKQQFNIESQDGYQVKDGYLGITVSYTNSREIIPFLDTVDGLEYQIATLANKMVRTDKKTIGFLTGHGEKDRATQFQWFSLQLEEQYNLTDISVNTEGQLDLSGLDIIVIAGPTEPVSNSEKASIHEFLSKGGKALVLIDSTVTDTARFIARPNPNNFNDFILDYGAFVHENIVIDTESHRNLSFTTQGGNVLLPYPYWINAQTAASKIGVSGEAATLTWAASIELQEHPKIPYVEQYIPLLETTDFGLLNWDYQDISPKQDLTEYDFSSSDTAKQLLAIGLEGSSYNSQSQSDQQFRLVVVGDSDWLTDNVAARYQNNLILALNWVDWLAQEEALASIRSKVITSRTLLFSSDTLKNFVQYANIVGVPVILILVGGIRFIRRRQFTQRIWADREDAQ